MNRTKVIALVASACVALAVISGLIASGGGSSSGPSRGGGKFDVERAWSLTKLQVRAGQRPAGSPQLRRVAKRLRAAMPRGRFEAIPGQRGLRNIVGSIPGRKPGILVGAHYDTLVKPKGFVGANNGAAGSAMVIEIARALDKVKRPDGARQVTFVLFDGEEPAAGLPEESRDFYHRGLRGSRAWVKAHRNAQDDMLLLDYVANKGIRLPRERSSTKSLWAHVRRGSKAAGAQAIFPRRTGTSVVDDHTPFLRAGIRAVDLIDWTYPGHRLGDRMDKLSKKNMRLVGQTVVETVQDLRLR